MAQSDALKKYLDAGMAFTQLTRSKAEQVVKELVSAGELQKNQAKGAIDELVERSRRNAELLAEQVRKEVDAQLANMGLARKADVERLEDELARLKGSGGSPAGEGGDDGSVAKKAPAKKTAKKTTGGGGSGSGAGQSAGSDGDAGGAKPEAAKKAPARKTTKKASGGSQAGVSTELPGRRDDEPAGPGDEPKPAKKSAKAAKKQG